MIQDGRRSVALEMVSVEVLERVVNDHAESTDRCAERGDISIGLWAQWRSDEQKVSMNAASCVQSTHDDDLSHEDALEEHNDPKMDRAVQAAQPCMDAEVSIAGMWRH